MDKPKPVTPYNRLVQEATQWVFNCRYRHRVKCLSYPRASTDLAYRLNEAYERVVAASQLGYDVEVKAMDGALVFEYVKRPEDPPYAINPD